MRGSSSRSMIALARTVARWHKPRTPHPAPHSRISQNVAALLAHTHTHPHHTALSPISTPSSPSTATQVLIGYTIVPLEMVPRADPEAAREQANAEAPAVAPKETNLGEQPPSGEVSLMSLAKGGSDGGGVQGHRPAIFEFALHPAKANQARGRLMSTLFGEEKREEDRNWTPTLQISLAASRSGKQIKPPAAVRFGCGLGKKRVSHAIPSMLPTQSPNFSCTAPRLVSAASTPSLARPEAAGGPSPRLVAMGSSPSVLRPEAADAASLSDEAAACASDEAAASLDTCIEMNAAV